MTAAAKIKRGAPRPAAKRPRQVRTSAKTAGAVSRGLAALPFETRTIERAISYGLAALMLIALLSVAVYAGVPRFIGTQFGQAAGRAGLQVKRVEVTGIDRMERLTVYAIALDQHSMAMPLVDLDRVRNQLLQYGWVEEARVSRRLPDTLVVDIVERKPSAIWQSNGKLSLIDKKGVVLEEVAADAMPNLPLLIGKNANRQSAMLDDLMERVPSLKKKVEAASWVGNRRWDLQFKTGETLALPEGQEVAAKSLRQFARIDGVQRLLGRGYIRFDMRDPTKFVARINRNAKPADGETSKPVSPPEAPPEANASKQETANGPA
jgi:cell division protein FtsQ